jgi:hypothetical protein
MKGAGRSRRSLPRLVWTLKLHGFDVAENHNVFARTRKRASVPPYWRRSAAPLILEPLIVVPSQRDPVGMIDMIWRKPQPRPVQPQILTAVVEGPSGSGRNDTIKRRLSDIKNGARGRN